MTAFKPMLASPVKKPADLGFPVLASPKLDGVRCIIINGVAMSRKLKPIPNAHVQGLVKPWMEGLDGELVVGPVNSETVFRDTMSGVMAVDGQPDVAFHVFDTAISSRKDWTYHERFASILKAVKKESFVKVVPHTQLNHADELAAYEARCLEQGYEGVMLRHLHGPYKYGRSTEKEGWLLKVKRFEDAEAKVIGYEEFQHNNNAAEKDALGHTKRSTAKAGKVGGGKLGVLKCVFNGIEFGIGSGFTEEDRQRLWADRDNLAGLWVKFRYFALPGYDAPRFPVFCGFRDPIDM